MSKIYTKYLKLKEINPEKLYLFESGMFYIFVAEDAQKISTITPLNLTNFTKDTVKCGFPNHCLEKYLTIFENLHMEVEVISKASSEEESDSNQAIIKKIKKLDIDQITPLKALLILKELRDMIHE